MDDFQASQRTVVDTLVRKWVTQPHATSPAPRLSAEAVFISTLRETAVIRHAVSTHPFKDDADMLAIYCKARTSSSVSSSRSQQPSSLTVKLYNPNDLSKRQVIYQGPRNPCSTMLQTMGNAVVNLQPNDIMLLPTNLLTRIGFLPNDAVDDSVSSTDTSYAHPHGCAWTVNEISIAGSTVIPLSDPVYGLRRTATSRTKQKKELAERKEVWADATSRILGHTHVPVTEQRTCAKRYISSSWNASRGE